MTFGASTSTVSLPMRMSSVKPYPKDELYKAIANNRFSNSDMERFHWDHTQLLLPRGTVLSLIHDAPSFGGAERYTLRLRRPLFYQIDFVVEPFLSTGPGVLPEGVVLSPESAAQCQTYQFKVTMEATFEKITSGNYETQEYKDWAGWLFSNLQESLGN